MQNFRAFLELPAHLAVGGRMAIDWATLAQDSEDAGHLEANLLESFWREVGFDAAFFLVKHQHQGQTNCKFCRS